MERIVKKPYFWAKLFAVIMFIGFTLPNGAINSIANFSIFLSFLNLNQTLHFVIFGIFVWLLGYGAYKTNRERIPYFKMFLLAIGYGFFIEILQFILPFRSFDIMDLIHDLMGIGIAIITYIFIKSRGWFFFRKA